MGKNVKCSIYNVQGNISSNTEFIIWYLHLVIRLKFWILIKWWKARAGLKLNVLLRVYGSFNSVKTCQALWTMFSWSVRHAFSFVKQLDDNSCLTEVAGWWFGWKMHYKLLLGNHYWYYGLLCPPPHHILVSVSQVYRGGGVFYVRQLVADRVLLDAGVVHGPGPLPRHQQAAEVVRSRLDVLWLRTADWQRDTDENKFKKGLGNILPKYIFFLSQSYE